MSGVIPSNRLSHGFLVLIALGGAVLCFVIVRPFLMPALAATALAILFQPLHQAICRRLRNRNLSAGVSVGLVALLTLVPAMIIGRNIVQELRELYSLLASRSEQGGGWMPWLAAVLDRPLGWIGIEVADPGFDLKAELIRLVESASSTLVAMTRKLIGNLAEAILNGVVTLITLFFLLRDGNKIRQSAKDMLPMDPAQVDVLFNEIGRTVIANMYGILAVATVQGTLTGLAFLALGLKSPVLWGSLAGLLSMIPMLGPPLVWVPGCVYFIVTASYGKAAILAGFGVGVIGLADNFIRPYVISGQVKLHPLLVFFSLLGGVQAFGFIGVFIGPAVLSVTISLLEWVRTEGQAQERSAPEA
jgi:predicted PurR-regulated permease PerM